MQHNDIVTVLTISGSLLSFFAILWHKFLRPVTKFIDKHDQLAESVEAIRKEITINGGGSLKDQVVGLHSTCNRIESRQKIIEQRTKAALHYSPYALFETDQKGRLTWTNEPFFKLTGQTLSDIKGFDWLTYIDEDEREDFFSEFKSCIDMNRKFSKDVKTSDGQEVRMTGYPYRLNDQEQGGFLISIIEA